MLINMMESASIHIKELSRIITDIKKKYTDFYWNLTEIQKKLWIMFIFLLKFSIFAVILHFLIWMNINTVPIQKFTASVVAFCLNLIGYEATANGVFVKMGEWGVEIIRDCVGWKSFLAFTGLIFATPAVTMRKRFVGVVFALIIIFISNIIRLMTTIIIGFSYGYDAFQMTHLFLWRWGLMFVVLVGWVVWMKKM